MNNEELDISDITESMELYNSKPKKVCEIFIWFVSFVFILFFIVSFFFSIEHYVNIQGEMINDNAQVIITNSETGKVSNVLLKTGDKVYKDETIYTLNNEEEQNNYNYYKNKLNEIVAKTLMLETYLQCLNNQNVQWDINNKYFNEYDSRKKLLDNQCALLNENEKNTLIETEKSKLYSEKSCCEDEKREIEKQLLEAENMLKRLEIKAPNSGILELQENIVQGITLEEGQEVGIITDNSEKNYIINAYVDESDVVKIKENMKVKVELNAYDSNEFDYIEGAVKSISNKAISSDIDNCKYYHIKIDLNNSHILNNNKRIEIKDGMSVTAKIIVEKRKLINIMLNKLNII